MLTGGIRLARLFGFEVRLDPSWFVIFFLVLWTLARSVFPQRHPGLGPDVYLAMGLVAAVLFFVSVLLHELSHSAVARASGIEVEGITLFIFGGVARTRSEPQTPREEFLITVVGPLSSLAIGLGFLGVARLGSWLGAPVALVGVADYLALVNVVLAVFNLVPGFPLDGGRIFRSIVWFVSGDLHKATRWASTSGRIFGLTLVAMGVLALFTGSFVGGIWFILIGWFLAQAAEASYRQLIVRRILEEVRVRDAMSRDPETVSPDLTLSELVHDYFMRRRYSAFPVLDPYGRLLGLVTLQQVKQVNPERWPYTTVADIMMGLSEAALVGPDDSLAVGLSRMEQAGAGRALVLVDGHLAGLLSRTDISQWLQHYQQLH